MKALQSITDIHAHFDRQFEEGILEHIPELPSGAADGETIALWNRYLTPVGEAGGTASAPFLPGMDPKGILHDMIRSGLYIHTEDNQVHYFEAHRSDDGGPLK